MGNVLRIYDRKGPRLDPERSSLLYRQEIPSDPLVEDLRLAANHIVLHLGAGNGELTLDIARRLERLGGVGVVFAGEFSDRLVSVLERSVIDQQFEDRVRVMPLSHVQSGVFPLADASVDRLLAVNVFQYLEPDSPYFQELDRVLKKGSVAILADRRRGGIPSEDEDVAVERMRSLREQLEQTGRTASVLGYVPGANWTIEVR